MTQSYAGQLLVASPSISDPLFGRSVCLIMHHDADQTIGVLLNRKLDFDGDGLWNAIAGESAQGSSRIPGLRPSNSPPHAVHFGGPLSGPVVALHSEKNFADAETGSGVYVAAQKEHLQQLVTQSEDRSMRIIVGHAAWKPGQLEAEIESGFWYLLPATADLVFASDDDMWPHLVRMGVGHCLASWLGVDDTHIDPSHN